SGDLRQDVGGTPRAGDRPAHRRGQSPACRHDRRPQEGCGRGLGARSVDPAADVDWSMGSHAARLADWEVALQIGKRVAGPGQFDVFLPPDDDGLIYFVGPNLIEVERRYGLVPSDFRLWVAIHEVTHRVQFSTAPWLRAFLGGMVDEYLETVSLDPHQLMDQLRRAAEEARTGAGPGGILRLLTPEQ